MQGYRWMSSRASSSTKGSQSLRLPLIRCLRRSRRNERRSWVPALTQRLRRDNAPRCLESSAWYRNDDMLERLLEVALDLSTHSAADEKYQRFVAVARELIPCDAIALL